MNHFDLTLTKMKQALEALDQLLLQKITLIIGGGSAMILAHGFPLSTSDIDAVAKGIETGELDLLIKKVAEKLSLPKDWLNPYFSTFNYLLPSDYDKRLIDVLIGKNLHAKSLGKEDLLIMKCFAARPKDIPHARSLVKKKADVDFVEKHIRSLEKRRIPGSEKALDFLHDVEDWVGDQT